MNMLKKFENYMSREEMCNMLCNNGYNLAELEVCTNAELEAMCRNLDKDNYNSNMNSWANESKKTSKTIKEHQETQNYMFFSNLETIKRLVDEMLEMDESSLDNMLTEHDWASDHISVAAENIEHVFNFVVNHGDHEHDDEDYSGADEIPSYENEMPESPEMPEDSEEDFVQRESIKSWRKFK